MPLLLRTLERLNSSMSRSRRSCRSALVIPRVDLDISMTDMMLSSTVILRNTEASCGR